MVLLHRHAQGLRPDRAWLSGMAEVGLWAVSRIFRWSEHPVKSAARQAKTSRAAGAFFLWVTVRLSN